MSESNRLLGEDSDTDSTSIGVSEESNDIQLNFRTILEQSNTLFILALPVLGSYVISFLNVMAPVFSLGHLGTKYLAASALTTMLCNVTGFSIGNGLATALDTLCSQSYTGSNDPHALGKHLQRGLVLMAIISIPITALWCYTEQCLVLLGQDAEVSRLSGEFALWMIPGLYPMLAYYCLLKYLQAQKIMKASLIITIFCTPINIILQYALVWSPYFGVGPVGASIATSVTNTLMTLLLTIYCCYFEGYECWGGWNLSQATDSTQLYIFIKLGVPGVMMMCSEWWAFEIIALMAGILGDDMLAAQSIILNTGSLLYCVPLGLSVATSTRIGNSLGANLPVTAKVISISSLGIAALFSAFNCSLLLSVKSVWGRLFSDEQAIVDLVATVLPLASFFQLIDGIGAVGSGILRGCGRQKIGAYINVIGYYVLGLPLGALFTFKFGMDLLGLWLGLSIGLIFVCIVEILIIFYWIEWDVEARNALKLVRTHSSTTCTLDLQSSTQ